jgi:hypothetical protein
VAGAGRGRTLNLGVRGVDGPREKRARCFRRVLGVRCPGKGELWDGLSVMPSQGREWRVDPNTLVRRRRGDLGWCEGVFPVLTWGGRWLDVTKGAGVAAARRPGAQERSAI